jgi:hypothetical protein
VNACVFCSFFYESVGGQPREVFLQDRHLGRGSIRSLHVDLDLTGRCGSDDEIVREPDSVENGFDFVIAVGPRAHYSQEEVELRVGSHADCRHDKTFRMAPKRLPQV